MVNINPNRESCMEYMKELIRKGLTESEVIKECIKGFDGLTSSNTFLSADNLPQGGNVTPSPIKSSRFT